MKISIITATYQRPEKLRDICIPSLLSQTSYDFEWVVVNDGGCAKTREVVEFVRDRIDIKYFETPHQGLIASRNMGLDNATSKLIGFLDDDNVIYDSFVEKMLIHFEKQKSTKMCIPVHRQRRDAYKDGKRIRKGKEFIRPLSNAISEDFVKNNSNAWFDSNGFVHVKNDTLRLNDNLLIMSDYEYLLQCFSFFGLKSLTVLPQELVKYIQTSDGIIGKSNFQDWLKEFEYIWDNRSNYRIFSEVDPEPWLSDHIEEIRSKALANEDLPGFPR